MHQLIIFVGALNATIYIFCVALKITIFVVLNSAIYVRMFGNKLQKIILMLCYIVNFLLNCIKLLKKNVCWYIEWNNLYF